MAAIDLLYALPVLLFAGWISCLVVPPIVGKVVPVVVDVVIDVVFDVLGL